VKSKGAALHILDLGANTDTATGKLIFMLTGAIAAFDREMMLERQREGIAKAKPWKYRGRKPTARAKAAEIRALKAHGVRPVDIARRPGIARASVYRVLEHPCSQGAGHDHRHYLPECPISQNALT
jgi:DNA invertase Pin-like site-specific DNA recombinase